MSVDTVAGRAANANHAVIEDFEQGRVPGGFHHADHVRVAFAYVSEFSLPEAMTRFSAALRRFARSRGKPSLYHETITWAYLFLIAERLARGEKAQAWEEFAERNGDLLVWRGGVLERFYSKEKLESELARRQFILPDRGFAEDEGRPERQNPHPGVAKGANQGWGLFGGYERLME